MTGSAVPVDLDLVMQLLAYEQQRAVPATSHLQVAIQPDAMVVAPIVLAGEDTAIHAIAFGRVNQPPTVLSVPDPRVRDDQYQLFRTFSRTLSSYFETCRRENRFPQVWVSATSAFECLDLLADRLRFNRDHSDIALLGNLFYSLTRRVPHAGQQALMVATAVLGTHWRTGQDAGEDAHLGVLLAWIDPPLKEALSEVIARRETIPMGVKTDPEMDRTELSQLIRLYHRLRRGPDSSRLATCTDRIHHRVGGVAVRIYNGVQEAIRLLAASGRPSLPSLDELERQESQEFRSFMTALDRGVRFPIQDQPKGAAIEFTLREVAEDNVSATLEREDALVAARARLNGRIVSGIVRNGSSVRDGNRTRIQFDLECDGSASRLRRGETLHLVDNGRAKVEVMGSQRVDSGILVTLELRAGQRTLGLPPDGSYLTFSLNAPDWDAQRRQREHLFQRLAVTPWTHGGAKPPASPTLTPPGDPLRLLDSLR